MIKDFLNRQRIDEKGREIAAGIAARYSVDIDARGVDRLGNRVNAKKAGIKLEKAISNTRHEIRATHSALGLGVYGKARLYKSLQAELYRRGFREETVRLLIEKIIR